MKKNIPYILGLTILIFLMSCEKFLEQKAINTMAVPSSLNELQALLDDSYRKMNEQVTPSFGEASSDIYFTPDTRYETLGDFLKNAYAWQPYPYFSENDWSNGYKPIYNTNLCLEKIAEIPKTGNNNSAWDNVYGSALFFRSYFYLLLTWNYGKAYDEATSATDPGIVLRTNSDFNTVSKRASVRECYEKVLQDTKTSIAHLPAQSTHVFRPSKAAAYGLLARTYLSMRLYDSAYHYADLCLNLKNALMNFNGDNDLKSFTERYPVIKFNKETIFYTEMNTGGSYGLIVTTRALVDTVLYNSYEDNDLRKKAFFYVSGLYYGFKGNYSQVSIPFTGIATDEMYLIRAECLARKGNTGIAAALQDLNHLLKHRINASSFKPFSSTDPGVVLNKILEERKKNFCSGG